MPVKLLTGGDPDDPRPDPNPRKREFTFAQLVQGREKDYPLLARAVKNSVPAKNPQIEWLKSDGKLEKNWTQIVRAPYDSSPVEEGSLRDVSDLDVDVARDAFLASVESILWDGIPDRGLKENGHPFSACGGVRHFLGRDPRASDSIILRSLREPVLWIRTHNAHPGYDHDKYEWVALERPTVEWLAEISLQVTEAA